MFKRFSSITAVVTMLAFNVGCAGNAGDESVDRDLGIPMDTLDGPGGNNGVNGHVNNVLLDEYCAAPHPVNGSPDDLHPVFDSHTDSERGQNWVMHAVWALAPTGAPLKSADPNLALFFGDSFMTWSALDYVPNHAQRISFAEYMYAMVNPLQSGTIPILIWGKDINLSGDPSLALTTSGDRVPAFGPPGQQVPDPTYVKEWAYQVDHCGSPDPEVSTPQCVKLYWFESLMNALNSTPGPMVDRGLSRLCPSNPTDCYSVCRDAENMPLIRQVEHHCVWSQPGDPHFPHGLYCEGELVTWTMIDDTDVPLNNGLPDP